MPNGEQDPCCNEEARPASHGLLRDAETNSGLLDAPTRNERINDGDQCCEAEAAVPASRMHNISIHALDFGFNVKIGCQNFAVETPEKLIKNLEAYLKDPQGTEKKWMKNKELL